ncbi:MAG: hypothetical protein HY866_02455 [Chloroflexi bacterium]|nr:hypothetical protein [Chloroflexota bacterium]
MVGQPVDSRGPFFEDWQACLRAHYIHVVRARDAVTEPTLRAVLLHTGLTEHDLDELLRQANALGPLVSEDEPEAEPEAPDQADQTAAVVIEPDDEISAEAYVEMELEEDIEETSPEEPPAPEPPDAGRQLSMF